MNELGKLLILCGGLLVVVGLLLVLGGRLHIPIGRLPGDIVYRGKNTVFYFPLVTSILLSLLLSLLFFVLNRWRR